MKTRIRLRITLKLWNNRQLVLSTRKQIKDRIIALAQVTMWDKAYLKVSYSPNDINEIDCYSLERLKHALSVFTEKDLLDDFR